MAYQAAAVDDEGPRSTGSDSPVAEGRARVVFVLRCHQLEAGKGTYTVEIVWNEMLTREQREFELNYDHLDQRHGSPGMAGTM